MYYMNWQSPGRWVGLTRNGYKGAPLLQTINSPNNRTTTRPVTSQASAGGMGNPTKESLTEEDIYAMPKDESDTSSGEENRAADIKPTKFIKRGSEEPNSNSQNSKGRPTRDNKSTSSSTSVKNNATNITRSTRLSRKGPSVPSSSPLASGNSNKRKSGDNGVNLSAGTDIFGDVVPRKKAKSAMKYGSASQKSNRPKPPKESPRAKKFIIPASLDPSSDSESNIDSPPKRNLIKRDPTEFDSPKEVSLTPPGAVFRKLNTSEFDSPVKPDADSPLKSKFKKNMISGSESSSDESKAKPRKLKKFEKRPRPPRKSSKLKTEEPPLTQLPTFKKYAIDGDLAEKVHSVIGSRTDISNLGLTQFDEDDIFMTQLSRCPMCRKPVDPEELKRCGDMNTRQQEKFCRDHQKKDAKGDWTSKGYPNIDWDMLDSRISQHHAFVKQLVDGATSHYRSILDETVKLGKDRNLLKSEADLTPGYYGTRGLRAISENIMHEFTPLLKKRVVQDRLMAARGVTGFVQSVLVPEVTVLLIMEDMNIMADEARGVLKDSVGLGALVHEEIRDVVVTKVADSDEDNDSENGGDYD